MTEARIIDFEDRHAGAFRDLNLAWIRQYWEPETADFKVLDHPRENVIEQGGCILMAELSDEIVGTCALLRQSERSVELAKMTVSESARGLGLGERLGRAAIERAKQMGAERIFLESNSALTPALALYSKLGFQPVEGEYSPYTRCNVQMALRLNHGKTGKRG